MMDFVAVGVTENSLVGIAQEPRIFVGFATHHDAVQILEQFQRLVKRLDATINRNVQLRHFCLESVYGIVV